MSWSSAASPWPEIASCSLPGSGICLIQLHRAKPDLAYTIRTWSASHGLPAAPRCPRAAASSLPAAPRCEAFFLSGSGGGGPALLARAAPSARLPEVSGGVGRLSD